MTRAAQVMEVMRRAPGQEWTASQISVQLRCAPSLVGACLRGHLLATGQVERAGEGHWRLASVQQAVQRLAAAALPPSPAAADALRAVGITPPPHGAGRG